MPRWSVLTRRQRGGREVKNLEQARRTSSPCGCCIRRPPGQKISTCKGAGVQCPGAKKPPTFGCGFAACSWSSYAPSLSRPNQYSVCGGGGKGGGLRSLNGIKRKSAKPRSFKLRNALQDILFKTNSPAKVSSLQDAIVALCSVSGGK